MYGYQIALFTQDRYSETYAEYLRPTELNPDK